MKLKNFFLSCSSASRSRKLKDEQQKLSAAGAPTTGPNHATTTGANSVNGRLVSPSSSSSTQQRPLSPPRNGGAAPTTTVKETDLSDFVQEHPKKSLSAAYSYGNHHNGSVNKFPASSSSGRVSGYHHNHGSSSNIPHGNSSNSISGAASSAAATATGKYYNHHQSSSSSKRILDGRSSAASRRAGDRDRGDRATRDRDAYQQHYQYYQHQNGYHQHGGSGGTSAAGGGGGASVSTYGNSRFYDDGYHNHHSNHHSSNSSSRYASHSHQHQSSAANNNKSSPTSSSNNANGGGSSRHHRSEEQANYRHNNANYGDFQSPDSLGVKKGDRIVWVRELPDSNESGVVRWTGVIEGEEIAGIEFDRPLGLGSGWYKNKQLFTCAPHRGGLVAVAGLILEDDYFYNPEISTKDSSDEDIIRVPVTSTGGEISPVRGDSSLSASSGIGSGSGSGIHSSPSPSPSSSSSTSLDVGCYDTSSSTSSTASNRNRNNNSQQRYINLNQEQEDPSTITVSKGNSVISPTSSNKSFDRFGGQADSSSEDKKVWNKSPSQLPVVDCGDGPVGGTGRVTQWTNKANSGEADIKSALTKGANNIQEEDSEMPIPFVQGPLREEDAERISGRSKGIQGHRNSCYLDSTLFAMFSFSSVFDSILLQEWNSQKDDGDEDLARNVQRILRDDVVNPLRKELYCTARNVMKLRETMQHLDDKLTSEEMDPQEFLQLLFSKVLNLDEFMSLSSGHSDFFHQVLVAQTDEDKNKIPTIQQLFEQSLIMQELKLKTVPAPALILQMPRSGNKYKMYDGILPNLSIDITDLMEDIPRMCIICGSLATHECPSCYGKFSSGGEARDNSSSTPSGSGAESTAFCEMCLNQIHKRRDRQTHLSHIVPIKYSFDPSQYFATSPLSSTSANNTNNHHHFNNHQPNHRHTSSGSIPSYHFGTGGGGSNWGNTGTGGGFGGNPNFNRNPSSAPLISSIPSPPAYSVVASSRTIPRVTMDLFAVICIETSHFVSFVKCGTERQAPWVFFDSMADRVENPNGTGHNIPQVKLLPNMGIWLEELEKSPKNIKEFMAPDSTMAPELRRLLSDPYICLYYSPQSSMYS